MSEISCDNCQAEPTIGGGTWIQEYICRNCGKYYCERCQKSGSGGYGACPACGSTNRTESVHIYGYIND